MSKLRYIRITDDASAIVTEDQDLPAYFVIGNGGDCYWLDGSDRRDWVGRGWPDTRARREWVGRSRRWGIGRGWPDSRARREWVGLSRRWGVGARCSIHFQRRRSVHSLSPALFEGRVEIAVVLSMLHRVCSRIHAPCMFGVLSI